MIDSGGQILNILRDLKRLYKYLASLLGGSIILSILIPTIINIILYLGTQPTFLLSFYSLKISFGTLRGIGTRYVGVGL